jgi:rhodanese-related sulfurtransferase
MWPFGSGKPRSAVVVAHVDPRLAWQLSTRGAKLVDVRSRYEYEAGHAKGARHVPPSRIRADKTGLDRHQKIVVICSSGHRSEHQAQQLAKLGFTDVATVTGGLKAWQEASLPVQQGPSQPEDRPHKKSRARRGGRSRA